MARIAFLGLLLMAWSGQAQAERARVDAISSFGIDAGDEPRNFVASVLREAGFEPYLVMADVDGCGRVPSCHAERGKRDGAAVSLHVVIMRAADRYSVSFYGVDVESGRSVSQRSELDSLANVDTVLVSALRTSFFAAPKSEASTPWAAWSLTGSSVLLGIGGTLAYLHARSMRDEFFDRHVNEQGEVFGISPSAARARESSAQKWALAGSILWTASAISGVSAAVFFVRDGGERAPKPAGISLSGTF